MSSLRVENDTQKCHQKEGLFRGPKEGQNTLDFRGIKMGSSLGPSEDPLRTDRWGHRFYKENQGIRREWRIIRFKRTSSLVEIRPFDVEFIDDKRKFAKLSKKIDPSEKTDKLRDALREKIFFREKSERTCVQNTWKTAVFATLAPEFWTGLFSRNPTFHFELC